MRKAAWPAVLAVGLLAAMLVAIVVIVAVRDNDGEAAEPAGPVAAALDDAPVADEPFPNLTETTIRVGDETLDVVLADESEERYQGLRERSTIGGYDGMLFVFDGPTSTAFTMSTVPVALDIGFYDADGRVVDRLRMEPCPDAQADCPTYGASGSFTYALETLAGDLPEGPLGAPR